MSTSDKIEAAVETLIEIEEQIENDAGIRKQRKEYLLESVRETLKRLRM